MLQFARLWYIELDLLNKRHRNVIAIGRLSSYLGQQVPQDIKHNNCATVSPCLKKCQHKPFSAKIINSYSQTGCSLARNIAILRCNVAILMCKLLGPNCNRFDKSLSKSYNVLKIYLQIFFVKNVYMIYKFHVEKNCKCNLIFGGYFIQI